MVFCTEGVGRFSGTGAGGEARTMRPRAPAVTGTRFSSALGAVSVGSTAPAGAFSAWWAWRPSFSVIEDTTSTFTFQPCDFCVGDGQAERA